MKRILAVFLVVVLMTGFASILKQNGLSITASALDGGNYESDGVQYHYQIIDGYAVLQSVSTGKGKVSIPKKMDGYSVKQISAEFSDSVKEVTIPNTVTEIDQIEGYSISKINLPDSISRIHVDAIEETAYYRNRTNWTGGYSLYLGKWLIEVEPDFPGVYTIKPGTIGLADYAFFTDEDDESYEITNIVFPDSLKYIGAHSVREQNITSVKLKNVQYIGEHAFYECKKLKTADLGDEVLDIQAYAFADSGIQNVTVGNKVQHIGQAALGTELYETPFYEDSRNIIGGCIYLNNYLLCEYNHRRETPLRIKNGTLLIADCALKDGHASDFYPTVLDLPKSLKYIGEHAFAFNQHGPRTIMIPDSVKEIGEYAFSKCNVEKIVLNAKLTSIPEGMCKWSGGLSDFVIPDSVKVIGESAFYGCSLKKLQLPSCLEHISENAFRECEVGSIVLPYGLKQIDDGAFARCSSLRNITIPSTVTIIGENVFDRDNKLIIYSPLGSVAERYAKEYGITWVKKADPVFQLSSKSYVYDGSVKTPGVTVKYGKTVLDKEDDYTVRYSNGRKEIGLYSVAITLKGKYTGRAVRKFSILPGKVTGLKLVSVAKTGVKFSWKKLAGVKYYRVEWSADAKTWKAAAIVNTNSVTIKSLMPGTKYQFRVSGLDDTKKLSGEASAVLKTGTLTKAPIIRKLTSTKSGTATVTWTKVPGAKSYVVYRSVDGKTFKATKSGITANICTLTGLKGGKTVYIKVAAVNAFGAGSAMSAGKSVTVRK